MQSESGSSGSRTWRRAVELKEFDREFRVLCAGMRQFFEPDLLTAYYQALGWLTQSEFRWLTWRVLNDTTIEKLPPTTALLRLINEARQENAENTRIAGLLERTPESIAEERAEARRNARAGLELIKAAYAKAVAEADRKAVEPVEARSM